MAKNKKGAKKLKKQEKIKLIVDTDPGVDDIAALMFALFDNKLDIKLLTTNYGNRPIEITTRNLLHFLEKYDLDVPVCRGAEKPLNRERLDAAHIHGNEGMGTYVPSDPKKLKCLDGSAADNMMKVIGENPHEITLVLLGPQTNAALLLQKHPEAATLLKQIVFMGGSPFGYKKTKPHISFNISSDPEACKIVLDSGVPIVMVPSELGRRMTHLTYDQVMEIAKLNDSGKFMLEMYREYWEPGFEDQRVATNDTCAFLYLVDPKMFKERRGDIHVDTTETPGKITIDFSRHGKSIVLLGANGKKSFKHIKQSILRLDNFKFNN